MLKNHAVLIKRVVLLHVLQNFQGQAPSPFRTIIQRWVLAFQRASGSVTTTRLSLPTGEGEVFIVETTKIKKENKESKKRKKDDQRFIITEMSFWVWESSFAPGGENKDNAAFSKNFAPPRLRVRSTLSTPRWREFRVFKNPKKMYPYCDVIFSAPLRLRYFRRD